MSIKDSTVYNDLMSMHNLPHLKPVYLDFKIYIYCSVTSYLINMTCKESFACCTKLKSDQHINFKTIQSLQQFSFLILIISSVLMVQENKLDG